jgi:AcrR family transcriptional regulator
MNTSEKIIQATLEIASEKGLSNTSLGDIANKIGIKKPSIYNHFKSKEELVLKVYEELRANTLRKNVSIDMDNFIKKNNPREILIYIVENYMKMNSEQNIQKFYKIVESEKYYDNNAALVVIEESELMVNKTKLLLQQLIDYRKLLIKNLDIAAYSFAYTIHEMMTELELRKNCSKDYERYKNKLYKFIDGFTEQYKV